jgi:hypothetical protein
VLRDKIIFAITGFKRGIYKMSLNQITMVSLEQLVSKNHQYRKFKAAESDLLKVEAAAPYKGYGV